ncbi:MAG: hypothetical protein EOO77_21495 [Oxalobacteraceae bacterium]|nr:MAG: hypothetical protein EOO77_21495 [Oxalobacteraceae bacterium]
MPEITTEDRQSLDAACQLAGANYGTRLYSAGALAALAIQRVAFEQRIAELEKNQRRFFSSNKAAIVTSCGGLLLCIAGSASYVWVNRPTSSTNQIEIHSELQLGRKIAHTAPPAVVQSIPTVIVAEGDSNAVIVTEQAVPPVKPLHKGRPIAVAIVKSKATVRSSPWIANPLQGEALRLALIEDRKRTRQLNDEQLQQR